MKEEEEENTEKFSDDPQENMKTENEILKLKMQAQFGANFMMGGEGELPPEIENAFLQNVLNFEVNYSKGEAVTLAEHLGNPVLKHEDELTDEQIEEEINSFNELISEKEVEVDYIFGPYPQREVHRFIRADLLGSEAEPSIFFAGMTKTYIYEEYYPNNEKEIEESTERFMKQWEEKGFGDYNPELAFSLVSLTGKEIPVDEFIARVQNYFDSFTDFTGFKFMIGHIQVDQQPNGSSMGFSEGAVGFHTTLEDGEPIVIKGNYKLYMDNSMGSWNIMSFVMPGFEL